MKTLFSILLALVILLLETSPTHSQGSMTIYVQDNNGYAQFSLVATNVYWALSSASWSGFGNQQAASLWAGPSNPNLYVTLPNFATIADTNTGQSAQINKLNIWYDPSFGVCFIFLLSGSLSSNTGDPLQFTPLSATTTSSIPFTDFAPGSVSTPAGSTFNVPFTMIVEPVPEPSSMAIVGLGLLTGFVFCRRFRSGSPSPLFRSRY